MIRSAHSNHCNPLKLIKSCISVNLLIYVKILKSSDQLDILYVDA